MARPTKLLGLLRALEREIEEYTTAEPGRARQHGLLYQELWELLEAGVIPRRLVSGSRQMRGLVRRVERHVTSTTLNAIRKAIHDLAHYRTSASSVCQQWRVTRAELAYAEELAKYCWGGLGQVQTRYSPTQLDWMSEVDEHHELVEVWVDQRAFEELVLASLEAYKVPPPRARAGTEVYAFCFGGETSRELHFRGHGLMKLRTVQVVRVAPQLRARATASYVVPNAMSWDIHLATCNALFPYLRLVGDLHSHPYRTYADLMDVRGWEWSPEDQLDNRDWMQKMEDRGQSPSVALIAAIAKRGRRQVPRYPAPNVFHTTVGSIHLVLGAYRILTDRRYSKQDVWLHMPGARNPHRPD